MAKGNNPELWSKLLAALDEKLQLGLLDHMQRVSSYHFEEELLIIEPGSKEDAEYLSRDATRQQLELLAQDATGILRVKLRSPGE